MRQDTGGQAPQLTSLTDSSKLRPAREGDPAEAAYEK